MAAGPADDVRSTYGPSRAATAPAATRAASSSSAMPPSGPTMSHSGWRRLARARTRRRGACSPPRGGRTTRAPRATAAATSAASPAVVTHGSTSGTRARRDCLAAAVTRSAHDALALSALGPRHWTTHRAAAHGTIRVAPSSVAASIACSSRPALRERLDEHDLGIVVEGDRVDQRPSSRSGPASLTTPDARAPRPSTSSTRSPAPSR